MQTIFDQVSCERLLKGQLTPAEIEALGKVPFHELQHFQLEEVFRKSAVQEIAALVRVPVVVSCDTDYESDDQGGMFPTYNIDLALAGKPNVPRLRLDNDNEWILENVMQEPDTAEVLVDLLGAEEVSVILLPDGTVEDAALTEAAHESISRIYEAAHYLASHGVDTSEAIWPAATGP